MNADQNDLNFLPDDYVVARNRARANRLCGALLVIVILSVAGAFIFAETSLHQLRDEHAAVSAEFDQEASRLQRLEMLKKQQESVARRATLAEALVERIPRSMLICELTSLLPEGASLSDLALSSRVQTTILTPDQQLAQRQAGSQVRALLSPEPKRYDVSMRVTGLAYTDVQVAQFISRLTRSPYFDDVNLLMSRESSFQGQLVRKFEVEMAVRAQPLASRMHADSPIVSTEASVAR